jgi:hypothetical protein
LMGGGLVQCSCAMASVHADPSGRNVSQVSASLPASIVRPDTLIPSSQPSTKTGQVHRYFGFHSRASFCASATCAGVNCAATISRAFTAFLFLLAAAKLNHMCAAA